MNQNPLFKSAVFFISLLLAAAALFPVFPPLYQLIFCLISCLLSAYPVVISCYRELHAKGTLNGTLMLLIGCILCFVCRSYAAAAFSLLFYRIGQFFLSLYFRRLRAGLEQERKRNPLSSYISGFSETVYLPEGFILFFRRWICYLVPLLASLFAIFSVCFGRLSAAEAVRRAAAMLLLGDGVMLCAAFPLCDYTSVLLAANDGVLLSEGALNKLYAARTLCTDFSEAEYVGSAAVYSMDSSLYSAKIMVQLAALVWGESQEPLSYELSELCGGTPDLSLVQRRRELPGYGSAAMIQNNIVACGNAKMMNRIELPLVPFSNDEWTLHLAIEDTYLGCICLRDTVSDSALWAKLRQDNRLFAFSDIASAEARRLPGEKLLVFSNGSRHQPAQEGDCYIALGAYGTDADIAVSDCGRSGAILVLRCLKAARKRRIKSFSFLFTAKLFLLLLSLVGLLPTAVCVPAECLVTALSYFLAVR